MTDIKNSERLYFWDNAKGFLIALVVLGHMLLGYMYHLDISLFMLGIYIFHMPAFAFVSGFLSGRKSSDFKGAVARLLIAYVVFNFSAALFFFFMYDVPISLFVPYVSFWYILALIAWRVLHLFVPKKLSVVAVAYLIALIAGFSGQINNVMAISRIICFFPFFLLGAWLPWSKLVLFQKDNQRLCSLLGAFLLCAAVAGSVFLLAGSRDLSELLMFSYASPWALVRRVIVFVLSLLFIGAGLLLIPSRQLPFLSDWGRFSLSIFLFHRFVTLIIPELFPLGYDSLLAWMVSFGASFLILIVFGNATANAFLIGLLDGLKARFSFSDDLCLKRRNFLYRTAAVLIAVGIVFLSAFSHEPKVSVSSSDILPVHDTLSEEHVARLDNTICISFVGDLILLRNQVFAAYDEDADAYDFSEMFRYAASYLDADLSIGVFEGPMAGSLSGFSTGDYDDGLPVYLNFPDAFGEAVRDAGIDLVSFANNHILDMGLDGAYRTLDMFDALGLLHTGVYRNQTERDVPLIIDVDGVRVGILSYTFRSNYFSDEYFLFEQPDLTRLIVDPSSPHFDQVESLVRADFDRLRAAGPDLIVVIPHMGTQFMHETDFFQDSWNAIFVDAGADIILGDHSHAVQPIEFVSSADDDGTMRTTVIVNSPGNFANSFIDFNGDATAIARVYVDKDSFEPVCASIVPMWTHGSSSGFFRALPIYEIFSNEDLFSQLSVTDLARVEEVQRIISDVMLGVEVPVDQLQDEYFLFSEGYRRQLLAPLDLSLVSLDSDHMRLLLSSDSVFFIGDSLTSGSNNGGYGWFEPLMAAFPNVNYDVYAFGGITSKTILNDPLALQAVDSELVIVALGANDIRYRNDLICAMTEAAYIDYLDQLVSLILANNPDAQFIFIAPWPSLLIDIYSPLSMEEKLALYDAYSKALIDFCSINGHVFVDPTDGIFDRFSSEPVPKYYLDHIHPNAVHGIELISFSFANYDGEQHGLYYDFFLTDYTGQ